MAHTAPLAGSSYRTSLRTHTCGELTQDQDGQTVTLCGFASSIRFFGKLSFIDLRDRYGITQVVLQESFESQVKSLRAESAVSVTGVVRLRDEKNRRSGQVTGDIEILADSLKVFAVSDQLPLDISGKITSGEDTRLTYRYLDLRRPELQRYFHIRHTAMKAAMNYLDQKGFMHVTTPLLVKSTPEGARDYVVPSRVNRGQFYALPQSPQLYKQLLMIAGFDRYFQFAQCLRDEDLRADRQPEHTQIDLEMSFVTKEDVFVVVEGLMHALWKEVHGVEIALPFPRLAHAEALDRYGSDKPDLRFGLELKTVNDVFVSTEFAIFKTVIREGGKIKAFAAPASSLSKKDRKHLEDLAKTHHAKGLAMVDVTASGTLEGGPSKFWSDDEKQSLVATLGAQAQDVIFLVADSAKVSCESLGQVRLAVAKALDMIPQDVFTFAWIVDFPLFEFNDDTQAWEPAHHPFCMPREEHIPFLERKDFAKVYCEQYDLTLNGVELCSGSIRISNPDVQKKVFDAIGLSAEIAQQKFGFLLEAMKYGAPPMGGVGLGFDRIVALLCGLTDIREVIAFPKNKNAQCPMDGCPSTISQEQLDELGIFHYQE